MRRFVIHLLLFLLLFFSSLGAICFFVIQSRSRICHNDSIDTIVLGNSRIKNGIIDTNLPGCMSMGSDAADFNLLYFRLKLFHAFNPQLKRVILGTDFGNLYTYRRKLMYLINPYIWDILTFEDWLFLTRNDRNALYYMFDWKHVLYPIASLLRGRDFRIAMIGGFQPVFGCKLQESLEQELFVDTIVSDQTTIHPLQSPYLDRIYDYCHEHHLDLFFLNMPSYPTENVIQVNKLTNNILSTRYPDVPLLDYELMTFPDSCYYDVFHLNNDGAEQFTAFFKSEL